MSYNFKSVNYEDFAPITLEKLKDPTGIQTKVLWTNSSFPINGYAAQTITVEDMSSYSYLLVFYRAWQYNLRQDDYGASTLAKFRVDNRINLYANYDGSDGTGCRSLTILSNTTIDVGDGMLSARKDTSICIPTQIIGIKFVSPSQTVNKYSTEEKIIGEWIDGKPIYRKVFSYDSTFSIAANDWTSLGFETATYNIDKFISGKAINDNNTFYWINLAKNIDKYARAQATRSATLTNIKYVILEYTKITD